MEQIIFLVLYFWSMQPYMWFVGFAAQLYCCAKGSTVVKKLIPLFVYLGGMALSLIWGYGLSSDPDAVSIGLTFCCALGIQLLVVQLAWLIHWFKCLRHKKKYGASAVPTEEE